MTKCINFSLNYRMIKKYMYNSVGPSVINNGEMLFDPNGVLLSCIEGMILWHLEKQRDLLNIPKLTE